MGLCMKSTLLHSSLDILFINADYSINILFIFYIKYFKIAGLSTFITKRTAAMRKIYIRSFIICDFYYFFFTNSGANSFTLATLIEKKRFIIVIGWSYISLLAIFLRSSPFSLEARELKSSLLSISDLSYQKQNFCLRYRLQLLYLHHL